MQMSRQPYFEELVNLAQVDPLFGIEFVDITHVPVHQVQTEAHHLTPGERQNSTSAQDRWTAKGRTAERPWAVKNVGAFVP